MGLKLYVYDIIVKSKTDKTKIHLNLYLFFVGVYMSLDYELKCNIYFNFNIYLSKKTRKKERECRFEL